METEIRSYARKVGEPLDADVSAKILVLHGQDDPMVPLGYEELPP